MNKKPAAPRGGSRRRERPDLPSVIEIAEQIERIAQARAVWMFEAACVEAVERRFRATGFFPPRESKNPPVK